MSQQPNAGMTFAELFAKDAPKLKEGEVVKGRVLLADQDHVQVDVGFKSEGLVDAWEFMDESGRLLVKPGDMVDVFIEEVEDEDGYIVLSKEKADRLKIWATVGAAAPRVVGVRSRPGGVGARANR